MNKRNLSVVILLVLSGLLGLFVSLRVHNNKEILSQPSDVQMIQTFHYPALFVEQIKGDKQAGEKIFKEFCSACHARDPKIDIHAPRIGDQNAWQSRQKLGMPLLLKITIQGIGAMPARGGCFECSDEQLTETIRYMLKQKPPRPSTD